MANNTRSITFDRLLTTTREQLAPMAFDNVTTDIPMLHFLHEEGNIDRVEGGESLQFVVLKELPTGQVKGLVPGQKLPPVRLDPATRGWYEWKNIYLNVIVDGIELRKNRGAARTMNMFELFMDAAIAGITEALGGSTLGIWSGADESTLTKVTGLDNIVKATGNTTGSTGNLSRTNSYWQNSTGTAITDFSAHGLTRLREAIFNAQRGNETPNVGVMDSTTYLNFYNALQGTISYNMPREARAVSTSSLEIGSPTVTFHGARILKDANSPTGEVRFFNTKYLRLKVDTETYFRFRDVVIPEDEDAITAMNINMLNLYCTNLARQAVVTGADGD